MTTALLILAVLAAFACPLHAFVRARRGRPGCGVDREPDVVTLRARQSALSERIAALAADRALERRD
jgi:hypothetical protein